MSSQTQLQCRLNQGSQKSRDLHRKVLRQFKNAKKVLILSSFDKIENYNEAELRTCSKKSKALWNITTVLLHLLCYRKYCHRVPYFGNIININSYRQSDDEESKINYENREKYLYCLDEFLLKQVPAMINDNQETDRKFKQLYLKIAKTPIESVLDKSLVATDNIINDKRISETNDKNLRLRLIKKMACIMRYQENLSRKDILKKLPINMNQLKDALKNYKEGDMDTVIIEKRGLHNKKDAIRTKSNISYIKKLISDSQTKLPVSEIKKKFETEVLGYECSIDIIYKIIREDLSMNYGVPSSVKDDINTPESKTFRLYYTLIMLKALTRNDYIVSIDEIRLKDNRKVDKIDNILTKRDNIESKGRSELIYYTLLLACSRNEVLGYYIVEGSVTSVIYLSFIQRIANNVFDNLTDKKAYIVMDDAKSHKASMIKKFMTTRPGLNFLYIRSNFPEMNFVTHILKNIRSDYLKRRIKYKK